MAFCLCRFFFFQSLFHMLMIEILLIDQFIARYSALFLSSLGLCLFGRQEHCQCSIILNHQTIKLKIRTKSHMFAILFIALVYNLSIIVLDHHRWLCRLSVQCQGSSWISTISWQCFMDVSSAFVLSPLIIIIQKCTSLSVSKN